MKFGLKKIKVKDWPELALTFTGQTNLPQVCPNCLAPGTESRRVTYYSSVGSDIKFYANFLYCSPCAKTIDAHKEWRRKLSLFLGIGPVAIFVPAFYVGMTFSDMRLFFIVAAVITAGIIQFARSTKAAALEECPLKPNQAVWGPAAFYIGAEGFGRSEIFKAIRPEWLKALADANPGRETERKGLWRKLHIPFLTKKKMKRGGLERHG